MKQGLTRSLIEVAPGFVSSSEDDSEVLQHMASWMVESAKAGETEPFAAIFEIVEHYIIFEGEEVKNLLIVGLLENLKNLSSWQDLDYAIFEQWLGPETHVAWRWLEKKWQGKQSLASASGQQQEPN